MAMHKNEDAQRERVQTAAVNPRNEPPAVRPQPSALPDPAAPDRVANPADAPAPAAAEMPLPVADRGAEPGTAVGREPRGRGGARTANRDKPVRNPVRNNVRKIRLERMMSKAELARRAAVSTLTIDRIERGLPCRMDTKRKILEALGLNPSDRVTVFGPDDRTEEGSD